MSFKPIYKLREWINPELLVLHDLLRNPCAIKIIEKNLDKISWRALTCNRNAIHIIEKNLYKFDWWPLSQNPGAIHIIEKNLDKINWQSLSLNEAATHILEKNQDKIHWYYLSSNPSIFELDYEKMKENNQEMYEDLIKEVMKPSRVFKNPEYDYLEELFGD